MSILCEYLLLDIFSGVFKLAIFLSCTVHSILSDEIYIHPDLAKDSFQLHITH